MMPDGPSVSPAREPVVALHTGIASLHSLKADLSRLQAACLQILAAGQSGVGTGLAVFTTDPAVATAIALPPVQMTSYRLEVEQLASPYTLLSDVLAASASTFPAGTYEFLLRTEKGQVRMRVTLPRKFSNRQVLEKIAWAIRTMPCGAIAQVVPDVCSNKLRLQISTWATGETAHLELSDSRDDLMALAGVNGERRATPKYGGLQGEGSDARLRLNGRLRKARSNRIFLADGRLCVALKGQGTARIAVGFDAHHVRTTVADLKAELDQILRAWSSRGDLADRIKAEFNGILVAANGMETVSRSDDRRPLSALDPPTRVRSALHDLAGSLAKSAAFWQAKVDERIAALQQHLVWYGGWSADRVVTLQQLAIKAYAGSGSLDRNMDVRAR